MNAIQFMTIPYYTTIGEVIKKLYNTYYFPNKTFSDKKIVYSWADPEIEAEVKRLEKLLNDEFIRINT